MGVPARMARQGLLPRGSPGPRRRHRATTGTARFRPPHVPRSAPVPVSKRSANPPRGTTDPRVADHGNGRGSQARAGPPSTWPSWAVRCTLPSPWDPRPSCPGPLAPQWPTACRARGRSVVRGAPSCYHHNNLNVIYADTDPRRRNDGRTSDRSRTGDAGGGR